MSKNSDSTHDLEWTGDRAFATENSDGFKVYQCKHCEDLFFATAMLLPCPQHPARKSVRRKAMSNYNWPKIREYLATKVMGWSVEHISEEVLIEAGSIPPKGGFDNYVDEDGVGVMRPEEFIPDKDINQAISLYDCIDLDVRGFRLDKFEKWKCKIGFVDAYHDDPAKVICLAVLKASGADLSDFEIDSEEEKNDE